eukprot:6738-Heterococcus_DN1.PRE.1
MVLEFFGARGQMTPQTMAAQVGIITPYRKQAAKIAKLLAAEDPLLAQIKVASVELWQGQERSVIIISTVRAGDLEGRRSGNDGLGFLKNFRRCNVSITRAKALLIVVGDPRRLQNDAQWGEVLASARSRGCYTGMPF